MSGIVKKMSNSIEVAAAITKDILLFPKRVVSISKVINKPTYYPEMERKTKREMWWDNFVWLCKNNEVNELYTSFGMDVKGFRELDDFIPHREFCVKRNLGNQREIQSITGDYNYIVLLRDKYLFASYLSSTIGEEYIVPTVALISQGKAYLAEKKQWTDPSVLLKEGSRLVYKIVDGECADGVMLVEVKDDLVSVDNQSYTKEGFIDSLKGKRYLVQNVVEQHEAIRKFGTKSVNTIRVVTIKGKSGVVNLFAAFLRLGVSADSFVDNRAVGGLGVGVDLNNGTLMKYGFPHDAFGVKLDEHPLSHIKFEGYKLPFWQETVDLVSKAHQQFYEIQSIGWDVVLTERGPVLLEGNDDWEISGPQDTSGGLKERWKEEVNA